MSHCGSDRPTARLLHINPRSKEHEMFNVRVITLAVTLAISGAALSAAPLASANGPNAAATATDDHNRGQGQPGDDNSTQAEPGDDKGVQAEPGDDKSTQAEPGDDKSTQAEPGDDKGVRSEPGDDKNRNVAISASSGAIKTKTAAKTKRHTHIRHGSHRGAAR